MSRPRITRTTLAALALVTLSALASAPAQARNCYEGFSTAEGCPWKGILKERELRALGCQNLAHVRNGIYAGHGYCFRRADLRALYNAGSCSIADQDAVPLNSFERQNIATIRRIERERGC
jgi:hypothetical protein